MTTSILQIAIVGMACRFPGAATVAEFWRNLCGGVESVTFFSDQELWQAGITPELLRDPHYVKAGACLADIERFDAAFFGFSPREAELLDVQQRLLLECAWEALEDAGYDPERYPGAVGVYAGAGMNTYLINNLLPQRARLAALGILQAKLANAPDYLATRISYKLNLTGPSINVQSACSTSLVAIHLACQALHNGECDMVLAGGVSVAVPQTAGYLYEPGGIASPDGHCRAFDARAQGTVNGNGAGMVLLKPLADALADGDRVYAVVTGSAINNDGARKAGFTAPSVQGQAAVVGEALEVAGLTPDAIGYIEAHGSGTPLGDVIEMAALNQVFAGARPGSCAIGSAKTNFGHLDAAAGVAGFIKTALALAHRELPPSLHFAHPNPQIDFGAGPFYVNTELRPWPADGSARRAGVSSFGIGGTNAHVILEEAPPPAPTDPPRPWQLLLLSAKTSTALETAAAQLATHLEHHPELDLADVAYTLQVGRKAFARRRMLVSASRAEAVAALRAPSPRAARIAPTASEPPLAFLFPGLGDHYVGMAQGLYRDEGVFRTEFDHCCALLEPLLGLDLRTLLWPPDAPPRALAGRFPDLKRMLGAKAGPDKATAPLERTAIAQPAVFALEYALARLWMAYGLKPQALLGYSIGEYVAACLAGVFSLPDALFLVARRAQLIEALPGGAMLAVLAAEAELAPLLQGGLTLAAVNSPTLCVCSGPAEAISALERECRQRDWACRRLPTTHAFHSPLLAPLAEPFAELVAGVARQPPAIPFLSNVTGAWIDAEQAQNPTYWVRHACQAVRFADGLGELLRHAPYTLLEVGPGQSLGSFALQHPALAEGQGSQVLATLPSVHDPQPDSAFFLHTLGQLWLAGAAMAWPAYHAGRRRRRVSLPTYPFERERCWIDAPVSTLPAESPPPSAPPTHAPPFAELQEPSTAPAGAVEAFIASIWQELLGVTAIGAQDHFFELGGHSLLGIRVIARIRARFQLELPLHYIFEYPTVADLALTVEEMLLDEIEALSDADARRLAEIDN